MDETAVVRALRAAFRWWPYMHGRGWLLRLARLLLGTKPVRFDIGGGTYIEGSLDDWMIVWTFMRRHEADAPFQRSLELARPGNVVFDVGANVGVWSLLAAKRGARVHAFEPVPALVERLRRHAQLNGLDIVINACAIGAQNGAMPFFEVRQGNSGASSFVRRGGSDIRIEVPVMTLDTYIERGQTDRVDLMKVDVEGAEILVFRGARDLLSSERAPIVFFELDEKLCAPFDTTPREVRQLLIDRGYAMYRWRDSALSPVALAERHGPEDLFALKALP
jgi:FkbM family methyltransferase